MRSAKEALVGRREVLLGGCWAVVRVADRIRRRGKKGCMIFQSGILGVLVIDMVVG